MGFEDFLREIPTLPWGKKRPGGGDSGGDSCGDSSGDGDGDHTRDFPDHSGDYPDRQL